VFGDGTTAPEEAERFWALVDELRADVRAGTRWRRRVRARFSLRSLRAARSTRSITSLLSLLSLRGREARGGGHASDRAAS
jgi:hypothetical protein